MRWLIESCMRTRMSQFAVKAIELIWQEYCWQAAKSLGTFFVAPYCLLLKFIDQADCKTNACKSRGSDAICLMSCEIYPSRFFIHVEDKLLTTFIACFITNENKVRVCRPAFFHCWCLNKRWAIADVRSEISHILMIKSDCGTFLFCASSVTSCNTN